MFFLGIAIGIFTMLCAPLIKRGVVEANRKRRVRVTQVYSLEGLGL